MPGTSRKKKDTTSTPNATRMSTYPGRTQEGRAAVTAISGVDGKIFPACFMDADGIPMSMAFCLVLHEFSWSDNFHCACKIYIVLDDVPQEKLLQKGNRFYLYHNYRKVAAGSVL